MKHNLWSPSAGLVSVSHSFRHNTVLCCAQSLSPVHLFATPWTVARQAPLSMELSRPEYWSEQPNSSPGDLPNPGIEPRSPALQVDSLLPEPPGNPCIEPQKIPNSQSYNDIVQEIKSISYKNFKWNIIYKNIKLLCYTHETNNNIVNQLYFNFLIK